MKRIATIITLLAAPLLATAQFTTLNTLPLTNGVTTATVDRPGELYIVDKKGTIQKIDANGTLLETYTPPQPIPPTLLDARDGARIFAYYRSRQEYTYLSPSLSDNAGWQKPDPAFAITPYLIAPAGDYSIVILDSADWSLKKVNLKTSAVTMEEHISAHLTKDSRITTIREYQNFIFLLDANQGILIFNSIGKLIRTIPTKNITWFNFLGEELYYYQNQTLTLIDLFTTTTRQIPLPTPATHALLTDERLYSLTTNTLTIYKYVP